MCVCLHIYTCVPRPEEPCSVTLGSLSEGWQPASPRDSPVSPQFIVLSSSKIMDSLWVKSVAPGDNNEGSPGTAHHSTPRAEHRGRGVSASKGCAVNEVILKATVIPALSPGGYKGRACPSL